MSFNFCRPSKNRNNILYIDSPQFINISLTGSNLQIDLKESLYGMHLAKILSSAIYAIPDTSVSVPNTNIYGPIKVQLDKFRPEKLNVTKNYRPNSIYFTILTRCRSFTYTLFVVCAFL